MGKIDLSLKDGWERIFKEDNPKSESGGWIQWKGTDVCMDIHCVCGADDHYDGQFFYFYECPSCSRVFGVGQNIKFVELNKDEYEREDAEDWEVDA